MDDPHARVWRAAWVRLPLALLLASPPLRLALQSRSSAAEGPSEVRGTAPQRVMAVVSRTGSDGKEWLQQLGSVPYLTWTERLPGGSSQNWEHPGDRTKPFTERGGSTRECGGILSFIVEYYDRLPDVAVFMHGSPGWNNQSRWDHSDRHIFRAISSIAAAPERVGYCSLNSLYWDWRGKDWYLPGWRDLLAASAAASGELHRVLSPLLPAAGTRCWCCAQFAVGRDRIRAHPKAFYEELLALVKADPGLNPWDRGGAAASSGRKNGRCLLLETVWHLLFGEPGECSLERGMCRAVYEGESAVAEDSFEAS